MTLARCSACGMTSDNPVEVAAHAKAHNQHKHRCQCGPCQVVYGDAGRTFNPLPDSGWEEAVGIWTENAA